VSGATDRRAARVDADIPILENVPLAPRTTLGVGGPARFYAEARSPEAVRDALAWARERGIETMVLGGGSNLLVADRGVAALVLRVHILGVDVYTLGRAKVLGAGAGEPWDRLVERAVESGWAGVECLSGIPGDVGATPIQNVGAYGQEVADTILSVRAIDRTTGDLVDIPAAECGFSYRDSVFKRSYKDRFVITRVDLRLEPGGAPLVRYAELVRALAAEPAPTLAGVRDTVLALRRSKSMVYDPADENHRSAGSFFTNPIVSDAVLADAREAARAVLRPGEEMPEFPAGPGLTKLAAGWLIERAGIAKGTGEGPVGVSTRHALAIVNRGGATASQIVAFAAWIKRRVRERFGVTLVPEPVLVGFDPHETAALLAP
jgi:UDP-N-acetylmuramate dehydrogenase